MKVLMINGSPHKEGCTYTVLKYMADILSAGGICSEIILVGCETAGGCMGCGGCSLTGRCITDDCVNDAIEKAKEADVPIHRDDDLAQTLSKLEIGDLIPVELYEVVAEILVFVDRMDKIKAKMDAKNT